MMKETQTQMAMVTLRRRSIPLVIWNIKAIRFMRRMTIMMTVMIRTLTTKRRTTRKTNTKMAMRTAMITSQLALDDNPNKRDPRRNLSCARPAHGAQLTALQLPHTAFHPDTPCTRCILIMMTRPPLPLPLILLHPLLLVLPL